jgi:hypothetical protein
MKTVVITTKQLDEISDYLANIPTACIDLADDGVSQQITVDGAAITIAQRVALTSFAARYDLLLTGCDASTWLFSTPFTDDVLPVTGEQYRAMAALVDEINAAIEEDHRISAGTYSLKLELQEVTRDACISDPDSTDFELVLAISTNSLAVEDYESRISMALARILQCEDGNYYGRDYSDYDQRIWSNFRVANSQMAPATK